MVNKCSVVGCLSLYKKKKVILHRFPLRNKTILPSWIAITGKENGWKPTHSSRVCCKHFNKVDYMLEHKKCVLKPTSVPTLQYKAIYSKYIYVRSNKKLQKNENSQEIKKNIKPNNSSNCHDDDDKYGKNSNEIMEYENSSVSTKYLTVSHEQITPTFSDTTNLEDLSYSMNTKEQITNSTFNKIMALNLKKPRCTQNIYSLYFKSPIIRKMLSQDESLNSLNYIDETDIDNSGTQRGTIFCNSIE